MRMRSFCMALVLCLLLVSVSSCGGPGAAETGQPTLEHSNSVQDTQGGHGSDAPAPDGQPPVEEVAAWTEWGEDTQRSYLFSKLVYTLMREGYSLCGYEDPDRQIYEMDLDDFVLDSMADGSLVMKVDLGAWDTKNDRTLEIPLELDVGKKPSLNEAQLKELLCEGTESDPWYGAYVCKQEASVAAHSTDPYFLESYRHELKFGQDGTCEITSAVPSSGVFREYKGTYQVSGDKLNVQITDSMELEGEEGEEGAQYMWAPVQPMTYEYRVVPTKTGLALVQSSDTSAIYDGGFPGMAIAFQKGDPILQSDPKEFSPRPLEYKERPTGQTRDASDLCNTQWTYHAPTGTFSLELREDGSYVMEMPFTDIRESGTWSYRDGTLRIGDQEFAEQIEDDGRIGFLYENGEFSVSIY